MRAAGSLPCDRRWPLPRATRKRRPRPTRRAFGAQRGQDQFPQLDDLDRAIGLKRAIMRVGIGVQAGGDVGLCQRHIRIWIMWTASCDDCSTAPRDWAIFVGADDSVQVRLCKDTEAVGLPACIAKPGTEGGSGVGKMAATKSGPAEPTRFPGHLQSRARDQSQRRVSLYSPPASFP